MREDRNIKKLGPLPSKPQGLRQHRDWAVLAEGPASMYVCGCISEGGSRLVENKETGNWMISARLPTRVRMSGRRREDPKGASLP